MGKTMGIGAGSKLKLHRIRQRQLSMGAVCKFRQQRIKKLNSSIKKRKWESHLDNEWKPRAVFLAHKKLMKIKAALEENNKVKHFRGIRFKAMMFEGVRIPFILGKKKVKPSS